MDFSCCCSVPSELKKRIQAARLEKKLTQAERAKQLLANRKQNKNQPGKQQLSTDTKKLTSQNTKKVNNQRKKMGV